MIVNYSININKPNFIYQQNKQPPLTLESLNTTKIRTYNVGKPGTCLHGTGRNLFLLILVALMTITVYTFFS